MTWQGILLDSAGKEIAFNFPPAMMFCKPRVNPNATSTGATGDIINKIVLPFPKDCVNLQTIPAFIGDTTDTSVNQLGQVVDVYCRCGNSYQYRNAYIEIVCYDAVYPTSEANRTMSDGTSAILFGSAYQPDEGYGIRLYPYYDDGATCQAHVRLMAVYFQNSAKYRWVVLEANNAIIMTV